MAELKSLTLGGKTYDSFPARPYWVDVTITGSATDGTYSTAATAADVLAAIEAGLTPVVRATGTGDTEAYYVLALVIYEAPSTGKRIYQFTRSNLVMALKEQANGSFEVTNPYEATDEVTTLPNPYKLTFTGAVSAEYDGSSAVSVEIPEGGGGGGLEIIKDITLEEAVLEFSDTLDKGYNKLVIYLIAPKAADNTTNNNDLWCAPNNLNGWRFGVGGVSIYGLLAQKTEIDLVENTLFVSKHANGTDSSETKIGYAGGAISTFRIYPNTSGESDMIPVGTRLIIYGRVDI